MTVYDYCHLGHARVMVCFDVITRFLRSQGYEVKYVRNITDIDDKIITRANENKEPFHDLTERCIAYMNEDAEALGILIFHNTKSKGSRFAPTTSTRAPATKLSKCLCESFP